MERMGEEAKCVSLAGTQLYGHVLDWLTPEIRLFFSEVWPFYTSYFFPHGKMSLQYEENGLDGLIYIYFSFCATTLVLNNPMVLEGGQTNRFSSVYLRVKQKMRGEAEIPCVPGTGLAARCSWIKEFSLAMSECSNWPSGRQRLLYTPAAVGKRENNGHCSVVNASNFCLPSLLADFQSL